MVPNTHYQVANNDLQNLRFQTCPASKHLLENADKNVTQRCANESTVDGHFRNARTKVMSILGTIMGNP